MMVVVVAVEEVWELGRYCSMVAVVVVVLRELGGVGRGEECIVEVVDVDGW